MTKDLDALDAMLPSSLGVFPGLCLTGRYVLSRDTERHRGNGLKAFSMPDGRIAAAVADTGLHGATAATSAVRLLAVLRGQLESGASLQQALGSVDRYASRSSSEAGATMVVALVDPDDGTAEIATVGHQPPLVLGQGEVEQVDLQPSRPLGLGGEVSTTELTLDVGDAILLHTDGLLTSRSGAPDRGTEELLDILRTAEIRRPPGPMYCDTVADRVLGELQHPDGFLDDVALLVLQRREPPAPFRFTGRTEPGQDTDLTTAFGNWLDALGVGLLDHVTLGGALREVVASVMEHARGASSTDELEVEAALAADATVDVWVRDRNRWRAEDGERGHGLVVAGGLVDHLRLHHHADGTDVVLQQPIGRPVPLLRSVTVDPASGRALPSIPALSDMTVEVRPGHASIAGAVGSDDVDAFRETIHEATLAGTLAATVDLQHVTRLSGPAVRVLFEYLERAAESVVPFTVMAGTGSAAGQVMRLAAMPHDVSPERRPRPGPEAG